MNRFNLAFKLNYWFEDLYVFVCDDSWLNKAPLWMWVGCMRQQYWKCQYFYLLTFIRNMYSTLLYVQYYEIDFITKSTAKKIKDTIPTLLYFHLFVLLFVLQMIYLWDFLNLQNIRCWSTLPEDYKKCSDCSLNMKC